MEQISSGAARSSRSKISPWTLAAAAALLIAGALFVFMNAQLSQVHREAGRLREIISSMEEDTWQRAEIAQFLTDPRVRLIRLDGLPPSPKAAGQLLWNPATRRGILLTKGLAQLPAGKVYELWAIAGNEPPVPAGTFTIDGAGQIYLRLLDLPEASRFDKFAVTLEPAGGTPQPTGSMHLLGSLPSS